jgi:hypothetical protein
VAYEKAGLFYPPLTRKKGARQPPVKINLCLVNVLKIGFLPVKLAKIWINEKLRRIGILDCDTQSKKGCRKPTA